MSKPNKKINALLDRANRLAPKVREQIMSDLREVIKAEREGRAIPSGAELSAYVAETYKVQVTSRTLRDWLTNLRRSA